jgi:hypothetical protein
VQVRLCNKCNGMCFRGDLLLNAVSLNDMQTVPPSLPHLFSFQVLHFFFEFQLTLQQVQKLVDEGCDVNFTTSIFPPLTIAANRFVRRDRVARLLRACGC